MSFQSYISNITKRIGLTPDQIKIQGIKKGVLKDTISATEFCDWLLGDYQLGKGHAMALWKYFIESKWLVPKQTKIKLKK